MSFELGINTSFAVKRWPEPERWAALIRGFDVSLVQHTFDLVDLDGPPDYIAEQAANVREACSNNGLRLHSTFTGLAAYSSNLLLHPDDRCRERAEDWYRRAIAFSAAAGAPVTGGHVGAFSVSDWRSPPRRRWLTDRLDAALDRVTIHAREKGLEGFLVENMTSPREPSTLDQMARIAREGDSTRVPVGLCVDVGHQCVPGTEGVERDPYAWLERLGPVTPVVHLQQSDESADHHWPFTEEANAKGRIRAEAVLDALERSGAREVALVIEIVPPFEEPDDSVREGLEASVLYWREALAGRG